MKALKKISKVIGICFVLFLGIVLTLALVNAIVTPVEKYLNPAPGKMIEVNGNNMHIYTIGNGPKNVVLLSGFGTASPVLDFMQLSKELQKDFTVTVVENFGYGWSDWTKSPRTNENIVMETRTALQKAGILPPYILVPHSISGLYSLYYANHFPEEVEAIVGLDTSVPELGEKWEIEKQDNLLETLRLLGIVRIALLLNPDLAGRTSPTFSDIDNRKIIMMTNWNIDNYTIRNEFSLRSSNCKQLLNLTIPAEIPTSLILASSMIRDIPMYIPGMDWEKAHSALIENNKNGNIVILEGDHYVHWTNSKEIASIIREISEIRNADDQETVMDPQN